MGSPTLKGRCWVFGDNIDTDQIIPAPYLVTTDAKELGRHCMEGVRPDFVKGVKAGDIVVAGENFGCGSSREHAPLALKGAGVSCVVAKSFARIFFRNAINIGLPILECTEAVVAAKEGETMEVNLAEGAVKTASGKTYRVQPFPEFLRRIIDAGGLINMAKQKVRSA
jgi:3-isopropylmalate/(R)-2-methylmalate dehydratase small subunit